MGLFNKKETVIELKAFADGNVVPIEEVEDEVFSKKMLGDGIAIRPTNSTIVSPINGTVQTVMEDSGHAVGIATKSGFEVLIHIGLDTVELNGEGFEVQVKVGQKVKEGQILIRYDKSVLKNYGKDDITMLIVTEDKNKVVERIETQKNVEKGKDVLLVYK